MLNKLTLHRSGHGRKLSANFLALVVMRGLDFLLPLITLPYLVRTVGLEKFGLINFAMSLALYFGAIIQYGFGTTATRDVSRHRDDPQRLSQLYSQTLWAALLLSALCGMMFAGITASVPRFSAEAGLYAAAMLFVALQSLFPVWFFQGIERMKFIAYLTLAARILYVAGLFALVHEAHDFVLVPLLNAAGAMLTMVAALFIIHGQMGLRLHRPHWPEIVSTLRSGRHACISQLAPNLYNNSSTFLLGLYAGAGPVGAYSGATKIIDAANSFAYVLSNTFLPHLSRNPAHHRKFAKLMLGIGTFATLAIMLAAEPISRLLFAHSAAEIGPSVRWLAPGVFAIFVMLVYGTNYLMLHGREQAQQRIALYTSIAFFAIACLAIPLLGITGAVFTLVGARLVMAAATYLVYRTAASPHGH